MKGQQDDIERGHSLRGEPQILADTHLRCAGWGEVTLVTRGFVDREGQLQGPATEQDSI